MEKISRRGLRHQGGFTLIELLVVVLIIGILAAIALPQYFKVVEKSRWGEASNVVSTIKMSEERVFARTSAYVAVFDTLDVVVPDKTGAAMTGATGGGQNYSFTLGGGGAGYTLTVTRTGTSPTRYGNYTGTFTCGGVSPCTPVEGGCATAGKCLSEVMQ